MIIIPLNSIIGTCGGKVLLTINFNCCGLMLAFLRDRNDAHSVKEIFDLLEKSLGGKMFRKLFPVVIADNGSEFSNPEGIELGLDGSMRTRMFYCHPYSAFEKNFVENNHLNIRKILPKGTSFNSLTQEKMNLVMSNINSLVRREYGDCTAISRFVGIYGENILAKLDLHLVPPVKSASRPYC